MTKCNKKVEERRLKFHRCGKCTNHCNDLLPENKWHELFHNYWKMGNWQRQRDYIAHHVAIKNTKRKTITNSRRKQTFQYFFTVQDARIKVCKAVFLITPGIGEKTVAYTLVHRTNNRQAATDKRGKHSPVIKITDSVRETVRQHINSFPLMESHYAKCKYRNSKKFLQKDLTIREMYRLYSESSSADRVCESRFPKYSLPQTKKGCLPLLRLLSKYDKRGKSSS